MIIVVSGSRKFSNYNAFSEAMIDVLSEIQYKRSFKVNIQIIHGGASGTDSFAEIFAKSQNIKTVVFPADWYNLKELPFSSAFDRDGKQYNKLAGLNRNIKMLDYATIGNDDYCLIAFHADKSKGTKHMIDACLRAKIPSYVFTVTKNIHLKLDVYNTESVWVEKYS